MPTSFQTDQRAGKRRAGVSIPEVVVYIAVLGVLAFITVRFLLDLDRTITALRATRALDAAAELTLERIIRVTRGASSIDTAASVFDTSPGTLVLNGAEAPPLVHRFAVIREALVEDTGSGIATLTPSGVAVTNFVIRRFANAAASEGVKVELSLGIRSGRGTTTEPFWTSVVLRNSYAR